MIAVVEGLHAGAACEEPCICLVGRREPTAWVGYAPGHVAHDWPACLLPGLAAAGRVALFGWKTERFTARLCGQSVLDLAQSVSTTCNETTEVFLQSRRALPHRTLMT
jgi:hypothetical protein